VAEKLKLDIKTTTNVLRQPAPGATGVLSNEKFIAAIFSPDTLSNKRNTEAIETAPNQLTAGRVVLHTPARTLALADVRQVVRERLVAVRAAELAKKEGAAKLAAWQANPSLPGMSAAIVVSRDQPQAAAPQVLAAVLRADRNALPVFVGVDLGSRGYAVARINKVMPRTAPAEEIQKQERTQYSQWWSSAENQSYYGVLKEQFKAEIKVARPMSPSTNDLEQGARK
jgi:peptidyl-prolyl cis-trans isomerase D